MTTTTSLLLLHASYQCYLQHASHTKKNITASFKLGSCQEHSSTYSPIGTVNMLTVPVSEKSASMKVSTTVGSEKLKKVLENEVILLKSKATMIIAGSRE